MGIDHWRSDSLGGNIRSPDPLDQNMEEVSWLSGESITVLIGFVGAVTAALRLWTRNNQLQRDNRKLSNIVLNDFKMFSQIDLVVRDIYQHTKACRFLVLTANNGTQDFSFVSAIYEQHRPQSHALDGAIRRYKNLHTDSHYKEMLKQAEKEGTVNIDVSQMPNGILKDIYDLEGVSHSKVLFLKRFSITKDQDRIFYCSVATKEPDGFTEKERVFIQNYSGLLRTIFNEWF